MTGLDRFVKVVVLLVGAGFVIGGGFCMAWPVFDRGWNELGVGMLFGGVGLVFVVAGVFVVRSARAIGRPRAGKVMDFERPHMRDGGDA